MFVLHGRLFEKRGCLIFIIELQPLFTVCFTFLQAMAKGKDSVLSNFLSHRAQKASVFEQTKVVILRSFSFASKISPSFTGHIYDSSFSKRQNDD